MTSIAAIADQSDINLWPLWAILSFIAVAVAILVLALIAWANWPTKNAASARDEAGTVPARALTNPECSLRGHAAARFADGLFLFCAREGCGEVWFVLPDREPFDQDAAEVVAAAEALLRGEAS